MLLPSVRRQAGFCKDHRLGLAATAPEPGKGELLEIELVINHAYAIKPA